MTDRRALLVCHDAGGTVPPVLALAEALVARDHAVTVLSQPSVRQRAEAAGCAFAAFSAIADYRRDTTLEDQLAATVPAVSGTSVGDDVIAHAGDGGADLVVVDANLAGALAAAESLPAPSAVLLHSMYATFVDVWFADIWPLLADTINATRATFGMAAVDSWAALFDGHQRIISVVPSGFDAPVAHLPSTMRHAGFLVPHGAPATSAATFPAGEEPAVLVGLSTTYQEQEPILAAIVDALGSMSVRGLVTTGGHVDIRALRAPPNVVVSDFVAHGSVLGDADAVVTHAGLGTVAAALHAGVPLVCTPISRDQPLNAARVAELGAGIALTATASATEIARAIQHVLANGSYRRAAQALAKASRDAGGAPAAAADLEALLDPTE